MSTLYNEFGGLSVMMMRSLVVKMAETPMEYLKQCEGLKIKPSQEFIDKQYLTYEKHGLRELWKYNGELWRWNAPCTIVYYENGSPRFKKYNTPDGFRLEYYSSNGLESVQYQNINGSLHRTDGPAIITYYPSGRIRFENWYENDERVGGNRPFEIEYDPDGKVKKTKWRTESDQMKIVSYDEEGNIKNTEFKNLQNQ